jgi:lysozyme
MAIAAKTLEIAVSLIKPSEELRLKAYPDSGNVPTIGWGHTKGVKLGQVTTEKEAEKFLAEDIGEASNGLLQLSPSVHTISSQKHAALIDFCFNCGLGSYKISKLRKFVEVADWANAAIAIRKWNKGHVNGKLVVLPGLTKRREAEAQLLLS